MKSHRSDRLRVAAPTLEPDPVFLDMLADVGASSVPATPRTARSAGLRLVVATAAVAAIASATWAAGSTIGEDVPLSPADAPTQEEPSGPPSHGNVGTPQPDVPNPPGSPLSPGLPGTPSSGSGIVVDPGSRSEEEPGPGKGGQDPPRPEQPGGRPGGDRDDDRDDDRDEDRQDPSDGRSDNKKDAPKGSRDDGAALQSDERRAPRGPDAKQPDRAEQTPQR